MIPDNRYFVYDLKQFYGKSMVDVDPRGAEIFDLACFGSKYKEKLLDMFEIYALKRECLS